MPEHSILYYMLPYARQRMPHNMYILYFTKGNRSVGSSRFRVWQIAEKLKEEHGFDYQVLHSISHSLFSLRISRFKFLFSLCGFLFSRDYKIFFIHKSLYPWDVVFGILLGRYVFRKRLLYDLDDAEWEHSFLKTWLLVKAAHTVFCGSHPILAWMEKRTSHAVFLPTVVDVGLYASHAVEHKEHSPVTIGWVGTGRLHFKDGHFAMIKPALDALAETGKKFRFVVLGSQSYQPLKDFFHGSAYEVVFVDELLWADPGSVPRAIQQYQFDVGVMPVSDTPFNRAKCALKAIEYMACGVPTVASRVGEVLHLIRDGENGYTAETTQEWTGAISQLTGDVVLRTKMGKAAQRTIRERYSLDAAGNELSVFMRM